MSQQIRLPKYRPPTTPGEMLRIEFLEPLGMTVTAFAAHIGVRRDRLSEVIHGHRRVTPDTALRFGRALGTTAQFWLDLQQSTDLWAAMHAANTGEIEKIKPLCA
jgi:addiction module HigA family antidote